MSNETFPIATFATVFSSEVKGTKSPTRTYTKVIQTLLFALPALAVFRIFASKKFL